MFEFPTWNKHSCENLLFYLDFSSFLTPQDLRNDSFASQGFPAVPRSCKAASNVRIPYVKQALLQKPFVLLRFFKHSHPPRPPNSFLLAAPIFLPLRKPCKIHDFLKLMLRKPYKIRGFLKLMLRKPCKIRGFLRLMLRKHCEIHGPLSFVCEKCGKIHGSLSFVCEKLRKIRGSLSFSYEKCSKIHGSLSFVCEKCCKIHGCLSWGIRNEQA